MEGWKLRGINLNKCTAVVLKCYNDLKFDSLLVQFSAKRIIMDRRIRNSILTKHLSNVNGISKSEDISETVIPLSKHLRHGQWNG
jgi:hypothetical protein